MASKKSLGQGLGVLVFGVFGTLIMGEVVTDLVGDPSATDSTAIIDETTPVGSLMQLTPLIPIGLALLASVRMVN
jgi:hypothetical protein